MKRTYSVLAAETAIKAVFDFDSDNFSEELRDMCPLRLFNQLMDKQSLCIELPSGEQAVLEPYFEVVDNGEPLDVFALLEAIHTQTVYALTDLVEKVTDDIQIYDTYVIQQDGAFWRLTPTQFVELCKEGAKTGCHTIPSHIKVLKSAPKGVKRMDCSYYSVDKTILVCQPLSWTKLDYSDHLKNLGIYL